MAGRGGGGGGGEETTDEEAFYFPCESSASDGRHEKKEEEDGTGEDASFSLWVDRRNLWNPGVPSLFSGLLL